MNALSIKQLRKVYANDVVALDGIDLEVAAGDFFALLGPNGAGKSTAIGIISSLVNKTSGSVSVFGYDIDRDREAAKACIGLVPQEFNFNVFEPIIEILIGVGGYYGLSRGRARERAEYCLNTLDLWDKRKSTPRELSGGMKRRLMIARAMVHEPKLMILDEPTAGVDIEIRRSMWKFLSGINEDAGITIILTTHYLEEAEALCRNVAIIDDGKIVEQGEVAKLLSQSMVETFVLDLESAAPAPLSLPGFQIKNPGGKKLEIEIPKGTPLNMLFAELDRKQIKVSSMRNKSNRLEEFFLRLVEHKPRMQKSEGSDS